MIVPPIGTLTSLKSLFFEENGLNGSLGTQGIYLLDLMKIFLLKRKQMKKTSI